jgi:malate synthase
MQPRVLKNGYKIDSTFFKFVNDEVFPDIEIDVNVFWDSLTKILTDFIPKNKALLEIRENLQSQIDQWHIDNNSEAFCQKQYQSFLTSIGYLVPEKEDFTIQTENVDPEVSTIAGPQLVVPLMNARFALNAANARWGSLYDALYGSDVIDDDESDRANQSNEYNPVRGKKVTHYAKIFLDNSSPLKNASHCEVIAYSIVNNELVVQLSSGSVTSLSEPEKFVGYNGSLQNPSAILLKNNGLHIEIQINVNDKIGKSDPASVNNLLLESALTTIQDCEDSIAAVDADDKIIVYRNWLGLMKGDLTVTFNKAGKQVARSLNPDRNYLTPSGHPIKLSGRSLQFIRNVGHLMTSDLILTSNDEEVPEGILDGVITSLIALHDIKRLDVKARSTLENSKQGSIYIVKPKMHGPEEVKFCNDLFTRVEECLSIPKNTIKMGIMDEERRTSANLKECIREAKNRVAFINTGFLDRTGDEIHTSMHAGPMARKDLMKNEAWISVYEQRNVRIGLQSGFKGKAQIGKGMWAVPDQMSLMLKEKVGHLRTGANCAWVPSPTAATLHALHYHQINVTDIQNKLLASYNVEDRSGIENTIQKDDLTKLLSIPLLKNKNALNQIEIQNELDNNIQGLLGYVVRWINQGVGCSTVPDINNIGRMEDRATLRISSQHICNWLQHKILDEQRIIESLEKMAMVVDQQNSKDSDYQPMSPNYNKSIAFQVAKDLIFKGKVQPSGYTEPLLHQRRIQIKKANIKD